jgi:hypothetical protein
MNRRFCSRQKKRFAWIFMVTLRQDTPEFRQSAVNLVLVEGLSARKAAKILPSPFTPFTVGLQLPVAEPVV